MTEGENTMADNGGQWIGQELAGAASEVRIGSVPMESIMAGGRRMRQRRRSAIGAVALASAVVLGGGVAAGLDGRPAAHPVQASAPLSLVDAGAGSVAPVAKDPLQPVRVVIGQGTVDGKEWKLWEALWPLAPQDRAYDQAVALWQERSAVDPSLPKPTPAYVQQYWQPKDDVVNVYATLDGVRQKYDTEGSTPARAGFDPRMAKVFGGGVMGPSNKSGTPGPLPLRLAVLSLGPDVAKTVVTWADGTVTEPQAVTVGDSPTRRVVVAERPGVKALSWKFFDNDGKELPENTQTMFTE
ncbi:hypothetical protein [Kitasatospora sp. NPDC088134]|uniref:hypothetical protein n=1 Tax=Kitasatospora sp. NPDC088134 TaxID=3364071 RepID=UPI00382C4B48